VSLKSSFVPSDSIIKIVSKPSYDSMGRLERNIIKTQGVDKKTIIKDIRYVYDKKNNIVEIKIFDGKGELIGREERIIQPSRNRLSQIKYYDSNGNLAKWVEKRYEIYRTKDRRNREIDY
jgi:hypothetical protein